MKVSRRALISPWRIYDTSKANAREGNNAEEFEEYIGAICIEADIVQSWGHGASAGRGPEARGERDALTVPHCRNSERFVHGRFDIHCQLYRHLIPRSPAGLQWQKYLGSHQKPPSRRQHPRGARCHCTSRSRPFTRSLIL